MHSARQLCTWAGFRPALAAVCAAIAVSLVPVRAQQTSSDTATYFRGMRDRRLFRLAEVYCQRRLEQADLRPALRAELTAELVQTLSEHAQYTGGEEQAQLWAQARDVASRFIARDPPYARRQLVDVVGASVPVAQGHWHFWLARIQPDDEAHTRTASANLREGLERLQVLGRRITEQLKSNKTGPDDLPPAELRALLTQVYERQSLCLLDLAELAAEGSPERGQLLLEARKLLKTLADGAEDDLLVWTARARLASATRLGGDPARALREAEALSNRSPPSAAADLLLAERVRSLALLRRDDEAAKLLDERLEPRPCSSGELLFLGVQMPVERASREGDSADAGQIDRLIELAQQRTGRLRQEFGGYWSWRADLVYERIHDVRQYGPALAAIVRRAQAEFRNGKLSEAASQYGRAAAAARQGGRDDLAFQWGFTRASIEVQNKGFGAAASDLFDLISEYPDHPKAAEAHLLAAYALGRQYADQPTKPHREDFTWALEDHRQRYPGTTTIGEATWMLAELHERLGEFTSALKLYKEIPWEHARGAVAHAAIARCFEKIIDRLREHGQSTEIWEREAISSLPALLPSAADPTQPMGAAQAETAVRLARILLARRPSDFAAADRWLARVLAPVGPATELPAGESLWRTRARQLRIISLAGQGQYRQARGQLTELAQGQPAELLEILSGLAPLSASPEDDPLRDLAELQLEAAQRLNEHRDGLTASERRRLDECLARASAATGRLRQAAEIYKTMLAEAPRDTRLLEARAEALAKIADESSLKEAEAIWTRLEAMHQAGSNDWLAARGERCRLLFSRGQSAEACKLLKVTRLLYPQLGSEALREKFAELDARCAGKAK